MTIRTDPQIARPWTTINPRTAEPLRFTGHPEAELDPWQDRTTGLVQVHATGMSAIADYQQRGLWLPLQSWEDAEATKPVTALEFCVHASHGLACYRTSGQDARVHGKETEQGRRGEPAKDGRWVVPFGQFERVTVNRKGVVDVQPVRF